MKKSRLSLYALLAVLLVPFVAAYVMVAMDYTPSKTTNHGEFLSEKININQFDFKHKGEAIPLQGNWRVLTVIQDEQCKQVCQDSLMHTFNLIGSLGKNKERIGSLYFVPHEVEQNPNVRQQKQFQRVTAEKSQIESLEQGIYIIDPMGMFVMQFPATGEHVGLLKDLKKLLRYSKI